MNKSLTLYGGDIAVSGMGVVMSLTTLILMPIFGINQGVQPIIGYNYGARKFDRVKKALKLGIAAATTITVIGFIATRLFPVQLVSLFGKKDPALIEFGTTALGIFLIFLPVIGFVYGVSVLFQAVLETFHDERLIVHYQYPLLHSFPPQANLIKVIHLFC
jgi:Na+-driven multidrug efflux pump